MTGIAAARVVGDARVRASVERYVAAAREGERHEE